jgi:hypothetical protein
LPRQTTIYQQYNSSKAQVSRCITVRLNGGEIARRTKPVILFLGFEGIPIRDEVDQILKL